VKGTKELRRRFRGVPPIRVASGTRQPKMAKKLDAMLLTLYDSGRLDVLRAVQRKQLAPMEVWEHFRSGNLAALPSPAALKNLQRAWDAWLRKFRASDSHRADVRMYGIRLRALASKHASVRELPAAVQAYREQCIEAGHAHSFNRARAAAG